MNRVDPSPPLFTALPKPPTASQLTVRRLIGKVQEGAIRVPRFQRPLRWTAADAVTLFDSILKGYPIGSLLFWRRKHPAEEVQIGKARLQVQANDEGWSVVDGQQRMTALAASLLELPGPADPQWDLAFDPITDRFFARAATSADPHRHVPLTALGDIRRLGRWLNASALTEDQQAHVEQVQQRILDYEVPVYIVETEDEAALRGVFARMNSTGVRMRADEVFHALLGGRADAPRSQIPDLDALQRSADVDGFGVPPRTEVLKALLAMSGLDPSKRLDDLGEGAIGLLVGQDDATEAIARTTSFLRAPQTGDEPGAAIPAYLFIPYPVVFVLLARWFHLFPEPDAETRRALARWVWRGVATGVHQRAAVSKMRHQVRSIVEDQPEDSLRKLLDAAGEPPAVEWSLQPFHAGSAASRVEMLALLARAPRDRTGPVLWRALLSSGSRVAREVFALQTVDDSVRAMARTAANRVLLDATKSHLSGELRRWSWAEDREALESHLIDETSFHALRARDHRTFLERRGARLRAEVSKFLDQSAGIGQPLVLPLSAYLDVDRDVAE